MMPPRVATTHAFDLDKVKLGEAFDIHGNESFGACMR